MRRRQTGTWRKTGLEEISGDVLERDCWTGTFRVAFYEVGPVHPTRSLGRIELC